MKKIFVLGTHPFPTNRGVAAMCMSALEILKKRFPGSEIVICNYMLEKRIDYKASLYDNKYKKDSQVKITDYGKDKLIGKSKPYKIIYFLKLISASYLSLIWKIFKYLKIDLTQILRRNRILNEFLAADIVVDIRWGDTFTDTHSPYFWLVGFHELLIPVNLNKLIIGFPQTIGPFRNRVTRMLSKYILSHMKVIMAREKNTQQYLLKMGLPAQKIFLVPDLSFYLAPISENEADMILEKEGVPKDASSNIVGITMKRIGHGQKEETYRKYIKCMANIIEYLKEKYRCLILLIPHDGTYSKPVYKVLLNALSNKEGIFYLGGENYSTEELRGVIGKCSLLISPYMHANISALYMCVPTISFASTYKAAGVFELFGQEKFVLNPKGLTFEELKSKVDEAWNNREKIRKELEAKMPEIRKRVMYAGELLKKVLDEQELK